MLYSDRIDAAERLAGALRAWGGTHPLVLAIPARRGADGPGDRAAAGRRARRRAHAEAACARQPGVRDRRRRRVGLDLRRRVCGGRGRDARLHPCAGRRGAGDDEATPRRLYARARADRSGRARRHRRRRRPRDRRHDDRRAARGSRARAPANSSARSRSPRPTPSRAFARIATTSSVRTLPRTSTPSDSSTATFRRSRTTKSSRSCRRRAPSTQRRVPGAPERMLAAPGGEPGSADSPATRWRPRRRALRRGTARRRWPGPLTP